MSTTKKILIGIFVLIALYIVFKKPDKSQDYCKDRKCNNCRTYIGCNGYGCYNGRVIGSDPMYYECRECAGRYCYK